ncbi:FAD-binding oxidoreductase [Cellulomonas cellasea]|uniref:Glycine/D-amino acid oxidase-like deaminating enzyme n=1 Tax=Cellulomonas cellasea TaxID=43670 RepID=A0A7W4UIZ9_9CELL|nr:FAD-dependent oxidoreductase [Cellulomonas cellasea]MBB2925032.1 glycine/D-amino acid oxidase-like deaminating enzyme [Cellulomonas cellasea]
MTVPPQGGPAAAQPPLPAPVWDDAAGLLHDRVGGASDGGLDGDTVADVVVVGAGAAGLWAAYYLLEADPALDVVVLEQARAATGGSARGLGTCSARLAVSAEDVARAHGPAAARSLRAAMRDAVVEVGGVAAAEEIDCDFTYAGAVTVARTLPQLARVRARASGAGAWGDEEHLLAPDAVAEHAGTPGVLGGSWTPDCAQLDPARLLRGLADLLVARGVRLVEGTRVVRVSPGAVVTEHGTVRTRIVVRAPGAWTPAVAPADRTVAAAAVDLLATEPLTGAARRDVGLTRGQGLADAAHDRFEVRPTADGRLVVALPARRTRARTGTLAAGDVKRLRRRLVDVLPGATGARVTHAWRAPLAVTRDGMPRVGLDRDTGLGWAVGFGRDGLAAANVAGRTLADLVTGSVTELSRLPWVDHGGAGPARPTLLPTALALATRVGRVADALEARTGRESRVPGRARW